tara:strand:- start:4214 stop:5308 length:1095 start_codon:yes stop_codon:yes gene_type:complete
MIPIFDISISKKTKKLVNKCLHENWISSQGQFVKKLEKSLCKFHNIKYCVATSSCTSALHLSLKSLNLRFDDEVICPALTFISPANMIIATPAKIVLVDIDPRTLTIDTQKLQKSITKKTKAIVVVHQFGHAADMEKILQIAKRKKIKIIEDNAESIGGKYKGKLTGTFGDISTLSFFGNKVISTGEGGAILTNNKKIYQKCLMMRDHGMSLKKKYDFRVLGYNYRMTNIQAAIGYSQISNLKKILKNRLNQIKTYKKYLKENDKIKFRTFEKWCSESHWLTTVHLKNKKLKIKLANYLKNFSIETRPMIPPVNSAKHIRKIYKKKFIISQDISERSLHLPSGYQLTKKQIILISKKVNSFLKK